MINPSFTVGQYVRIERRSGKVIIGIIEDIEEPCDLGVRCDDQLEWICTTISTSCRIATPQEISAYQEQVKRQAYADQYL